VVIAFCLSLIAFTSVAFAKPAIAERFLSAFASSARTHYIEQLSRVLIGAALVVLSPAMWQPKMFWIFGWAIVVSSVVLLCVPWQWHRRLGRSVSDIAAACSTPQTVRRRLIRTGRLAALRSFCRSWSRLTNRWSGRVRDKVPSSYHGVRAAQLNR